MPGSNRIERGVMVGEFGRGSMVAAIPYGYKIDPIRTAEIGRCQWALDPQASEVVKEIFRARKEGMSLNQIAAVLNIRGVTPPQPGNNPEGNRHGGQSMPASAFNKIFSF